MKKIKIFFWITEFLLFLFSAYLVLECTKYNILLEPLICNNATLIMIILSVLFIINSLIIIFLD